MNYLLPLVKSFLLEFLEAAKIVIFNILLFVLCKYHVGEVRSIDVYWLVSILHRLKPWVFQCLLCRQPLSVINLNKAAYEILGFI